MTKINWREILENNENEILEKLKEAYKDSLNNTHMRFCVVVYEDGKVEQFSDIAGGNSQLQSVWNGEAIESLDFCNQYWNVFDDWSMEDEEKYKAQYGDDAEQMAINDYFTDNDLPDSATDIDIAFGTEYWED